MKGKKTVSTRAEGPSVIVPVDNATDIVGRGVESLCSQTWAWAEILVLDEDTAEGRNG